MSPISATVRIVVPCKNADATIESCLRALYQSRGIERHVLVVDDGGNSVLNGLQAKYSFDLVASPGETGAGAARNLGVRGFRGNVVVFVDADIEVTSLVTIATLVAPIVRGEAEATVGCYSSARRNNFFETYKHLYLAYTYSKTAGELKNTFWTGLCAVNRVWFEALQGFKECYAGAGPEDIEFGVAMTKRGGRIHPVSEAQGTHLASMSFKGLVWNDLRKGSEDIYVHWSRKIPLTNNRHVETADILAVAFASLSMFCLLLIPLVGNMPAILCGLFYLAFRRKLLVNAFWGEGILPFFGSVLLSFVLDLVRACAVLAGTFLWGCERVTGGRWGPFLKPSTH
jgi:cellulose synthase/poly-beta-1,6-N-acetylglucosamine synthase-like glycosyltransferase